MTDEERERIEAQLKSLAAVEKAIVDAMAPFRTAVRAIGDARCLLLEQQGLEIRGTCEGCECILFVGDRGHICRDGPLLCEECAPTLGDLDEQFSGMTTDGDEEETEIAEALAAVRARLTGGDPRDTKDVWVL